MAICKALALCTLTVQMSIKTGSRLIDDLKANKWLNEMAFN